MRIEQCAHWTPSGAIHCATVLQTDPNEAHLPAGVWVTASHADAFTAYTLAQSSAQLVIRNAVTFGLVDMGLARSFEELCGFVMVVDAEDADEDLPTGHYLVVPLPDSLDGAMRLMQDGQAGRDVIAAQLGEAGADLAMEATFALKIGNAAVVAHTEAEA